MLRHIQYGRALAALLVVLAHVSHNLAKDKYFGGTAQVLDDIFWFGGDAGVAFFFVLSGFLIHHIHAQDLGRPHLFPRYMHKRVMRIYPTYWIIFLGVYLSAMVVPALRGTVPDDPIVLLKSLLLMPQDADVVGGTGAPVLVVAWTLQYEMFFYLVFGLGILRRGLLFALCSAALLGLAANLLLGPFDFPGRFFTSPYIVLFLMGMLASRLQGMAFEWRAPVHVALAAAAVFGAAALAAIFFKDELPKTLFSLTYGAAASVLLLALVRYDRGRPARIPTRYEKMVLQVGDASYALYLIHFPLVSLFAKVAVTVLPVHLASAIVAMIGSVAASILVSVLFHQHLERPLLNHLMPRQHRGVPRHEGAQGSSP